MNPYLQRYLGLDERRHVRGAEREGALDVAGDAEAEAEPQHRGDDVDEPEGRDEGEHGRTLAHRPGARAAAAGV